MRREEKRKKEIMTHLNVSRRFCLLSCYRVLRDSFTEDGNKPFFKTLLPIFTCLDDDRLYSERVAQR